MRLCVGLLVLLLTQAPLFAQPDSRATVVRGCVTLTHQGVALTVPDMPGDAFNPMLTGHGFVLAGDDSLLNEIARREGNEIEVTGHRNSLPGALSVNVVEGGTFVIKDAVVVTEYKMRRAGCNYRNGSFRADETPWLPDPRR